MTTEEIKVLVEKYLQASEALTDAITQLNEAEDRLASAQHARQRAHNTFVEAAEAALKAIAEDSGQNWPPKKEPT